MSKYVIYVLDKLVWMLLIAIFTTQALQIAGIMDTPQTLGEITYTEGNNHEYQITAGLDSRGKRHTEDKYQPLNRVLNIPIASLYAANELLNDIRLKNV